MKIEKKNDGSLWDGRLVIGFTLLCGLLAAETVNALEEQARKLNVSPDKIEPEQWLETFYARRKGSGKEGLAAARSSR